jgi:mediator of RNA polymerase II transcription subunit 12, fungi type
MGVQPRPPQRTLSSSGLSVQRPAHQRTLSQQYLPPSPIRKETFLDSASEASDVAQSRYGTTPRRGGSRLKLEFSNDSMLAQAAVVGNSPQTLTPSRIMPHESSDLSDMSPNASAKGQGGDSDHLPLPMPKRRPPISRSARSRGMTASSATPVKKDSRPKPYTLETPPVAPYYPSTGKAEPVTKLDIGNGGSGGSDGVKPPRLTHADFFPWTGEHPEDHFSDHVIRHGFFDKAPMAQTETVSAKAALFPALKHKSGLNALSTIFMGVLGQRRHGGQITAPSTFKPPPRVTLTDTKREVWLKDLANPSITLRRLSRTIPHGIRGKGLLDQCLNKNVPTDRAVWLARCVGANEIRASKRKGVNGTSHIRVSLFSGTISPGKLILLT